MELIKARIKGIAPILLHNGHLVDPRNPFTKEIDAAQKANKKNKSDAAFEALANCEWLGGLYTKSPISFVREGTQVDVTSDSEIGVTGDMICRSIIKSAGRKEVAAFKAGVIVEGFFPLMTGGKIATVKRLFKNPAHYFTVAAKIGTSKIMRTRPRIDDWSATIEVAYIPELVTKRDVQDALVRSGSIVGIGDWRPRFGRFAVEF
jgi:hypothetical protein